MKDFTVVANSGIQLFTMPLKINLQDKFTLWFHEWQAPDEQWVLDLSYAHKDVFEDDDSSSPTYYYKKKDLFDKGFFAESQSDFNTYDLKDKGISPICIDDTLADGVNGDLYKLTFHDKDNTLACFENVWLPIPYFFKKSEKRFQFGPLNWVRFKMIPQQTDESGTLYNVLFAIDTRSSYESMPHSECPVFPDKYTKKMNFMVCSNEYQVLDMCNPNVEYSYIENYLFKLVHPELQHPSQIKNSSKKLNYLASYVFLIQYIAKNNLFPAITLYRDIDVESKNVDLVVDIGNSQTTALLVEDGFEDFTKVPKLRLVDFTNPIDQHNNNLKILAYEGSFDMRVAFRKASFGNFGPLNSHQFVHPSLVRLGQEANYLIHNSLFSDSSETVSTCSSPKRYLWDGRPNKEEWQFILLEGENPDTQIIHLPGITNQLTSSGELDRTGNGGKSNHYSRQSLMTFAFLEMLIQAKAQINSDQYREEKGGKDLPRQLKRVIITCPTAMSKLEREKLIGCAKNAVHLLENFYQSGNSDTTFNKSSIEVAPNVIKRSEEQEWYYDEATCSQLVYMFGEIGHKYKGCCDEFFNLYGKKRTENETQSTLIVGSLDIGAGTSDLMINKYSYHKDALTTLSPDPLFYDSFYYAGDDMLKGLIIDLMMRDEKSAFFLKQANTSYETCHQKLRDVFGPNFNGQTEEDRIFRKDFNLQYSVPLMCYFLDLVSKRSSNCIVHYHDVFENLPPHKKVKDRFKQIFGYELESLEWMFDYDKIAKKISDNFEPYLKKIAAIMFAQACDLIILSGRPASLPPIRELFLKYYPVSPDRLILLNNYYVGRWFPYGKNTGYVVDAKTIVAVGAVIGHYSSKLSSLNNFAIDTSKLDGRLKSTVNFIEQQRDSSSITYCITPAKPVGEISVTKLPTHLNVRQIGIDAYPARSLYAIDFNREKIKTRIIKSCINNGTDIPTDSKLIRMVNDEVDKIRNRAPFKISLEKDIDDNETLSITSIEDKFGNDLSENNIDVHIQSLGVEERYWLDDGAFNF